MSHSHFASLHAHASCRTMHPICQASAREQAFLLSSNLATLFGGRVFEVKLFPFSFNEYLKYFPSNDVDDAFDDYVKKGGMAGSYLYKTEDDARKYVNGIYRTTITKDIVTKFKIENEDLLVMIGNFLKEKQLRDPNGKTSLLL